MVEDNYLNILAADLAPTPHDNAGLDGVLTALERDLTLAGVPATRLGSFPKGTLVRDHDTADLLVGLNTWPGGKPLATPEALSEILPGRQVSRVDGVLTVQFDQYSVDLLPRQIQDVEADLPDRVRFASLGLEHLRWWQDHGRGSPASVVRLLKRWRDRDRALRGLSGIALETLVVAVLGDTPPEDLQVAFAAVISVMAGGELLLERGLGRLPDPADPLHDLLAPLGDGDRRQLQVLAQQALRFIENDTWSQLFTKCQPLPAPRVNLGGQTLA